MRCILRRAPRALPGRAEEQLQGRKNPDFCATGQSSLCLRYSEARGLASAREVEPQAMLALSPLWYLVV